MARGTLVGIDFVVVSTLKRLVTKEVNGGVFDAGDVLLGLDMLKAISLIPTSWEHIKGNLPTNGVSIRGCLLARLTTV